MRTESKPVIGFIGTGVMGRSMAGHLLKAGYPLHIYTRTRSKAADLESDGAQWSDSPASVASQADVVMTIVGYPQDVEEVYLGEHGILSSLKPGGITVDMTTSSPLLAQKIAEEALKRGCKALDAPVSGGDVGAKEARLSIMAGGDAEAFERCRPLFEVMGKNIILQGKAGSGQFTKMANQIAIAGGMLGVTEAMVYAVNSGLDPEKVLESISGGAAGSWSLSNLAPRMLKNDFAPGFYVKHFIKDMKIAIESAQEMKLNLPGLELACRLYKKLAENGGENEGTQALFRFYKSIA